ncbi:MAG: RHS repeat-associated core domain-containing protein, partial [Chloroflexi bacterium]|nr:RHS repeat-associated core domain-containing protein [Chloroflexota bacterium]
PVLGRFVSPDSIVPEPGSSGGFNRYRYARNNPLKYVDPTGHQGGCPEQDPVCETVEYIQEMGDQLTDAVQLFIDESLEVAGDLPGNVSIPAATVKPSIVQHGQDTPRSLGYAESAFAADTIDFGITSSIAGVGIVGGLLSGGTIAGFAEAANVAASPITVPAGTAGWIFTIAADLSAGRTELSNGSIYIGTDSIVSTLTFVGGDVNPELYTSSIADSIQYGWDMARKEGQDPTSLRIEFSYFPAP